MTLAVPFLNPGDLIEILAPAKSIEASHVNLAKNYLENKGFKVKISSHCLGNSAYFSGTVQERLQDFQSALDNEEVKAILCARGGYGCVQLVDKLQWAGFLRSPKWIVGFSDVTVFHQKIVGFGIKSIHGTMPLNFLKNSDEALSTLYQSLIGDSNPIVATPNKNNLLGKSTGKLVGGNLSILYSALGTDDQPDYSSSILFIEDLAEQLYHIDRMFYAFGKAGILDKINGLVVGGMTNLQDTEVPFGRSLQEIILSHFQYRKIPICFGFPVGHIDDNRALVHGANVKLDVSNDNATMSYL